MRDLLSLLEKQADKRVLDSFCDFFEYHGVLGFRMGRDLGWSPVSVLEFVPLAFGLLPIEAAYRVRVDQRIKPSIRKHLGVLGVTPSERLVGVVKSISDQYYATGLSGHRRKLGIADIRAMSKLYAGLRGRQSGRCCVCGVSFASEGEAMETLDHIVPWRLIGDVPDGSNFQILCDGCNLGKRDWLSCLQSPCLNNWIYGRPRGAEDRFDPDTRYVALVLAGRCSESGCENGPDVAHLRVSRRFDTGLAVLDNAKVTCEYHTPSPEHAV